MSGNRWPIFTLAPSSIPPVRCSSRIFDWSLVRPFCADSRPGCCRRVGGPGTPNSPSSSQLTIRPNGLPARVTYNRNRPSSRSRMPRGSFFLVFSFSIWSPLLLSLVLVILVLVILALGSHLGHPHAAPAPL